MGPTLQPTLWSWYHINSLRGFFICFHLSALFLFYLLYFLEMACALVFEGHWSTTLAVNIRLLSYLPESQLLPLCYYRGCCHSSLKYPFLWFIFFPVFSVLLVLAQNENSFETLITILLLLGNSFIWRLLTPYSMQSTCTWYITRLKKYFVQSSWQKLQI